MKIVINDKEINIKNCTSFKDRLLGFMFKKNITSALLFERCNSIHTLFMKEDIDVIGLDDNNKVVGYKKCLKPYKFLKISLLISDGYDDPLIDPFNGVEFKFPIQVIQV